MISKISSVENSKYTPNWDTKKQPSFNGLGDALLTGIQLCEQNPMLNVSVLDLSTAIIPRSIIETKQSNAFAGMEAFRRESSGLIVNCLIPSFIVMGVASLLQKPIMGATKSNLHNVWANEESLKLINSYWEKAEGTGKTKFTNAVSAFLNDIEGVDGKSVKAFKDFDLKKGIETLSEAYDAEKPSKLIKKGYLEIAENTHVTENIRVKDGKGFLTKNLKGYLEDFVNISKSIEKEGLKSSDEVSKFINKAVKLVNWKSAAGLGLIIPLAISMQPINRWLTARSSGVKGAPIYKDFGENKDNHKELSGKEKADLLKQKIISVGSMLGVAFMSMGFKLPNKQMLQFKGIFPTMDQARLISTATFASRMASSEDKNELREATVRDIATFSSLYFLGDYAAKGVATLIEKFKPDIKLLNTLKEAPQDANAMKKFWHWVKDVSLKSSDEVVGKTAKNMRSLCQLGNIAFSLLALGIFIPLYTRTQTNKKRELELKAQAESINSTNGFLKDQIKNSSPAFKSFFSLQ